jgi:hypothetical protein
MGEQQRGLTSATHSRRPERPERPEPSWPAVAATTARLWFERHKIPRMRPVSGRRRLIAILLSAVILVALGAELTSIVTSPTRVTQSQNRISGGGGTSALQVAAAYRHSAAAWIAQQVSPSVIVSCDPEMCSELQASGFPPGQLMELRPAAPDPLGSVLVVATPAIRSQFGARLGSVYAPLVVASFGAGAGLVEIRAVAPDGSAAFLSTLAADRAARISAGKQLLLNKHIQASAPARAALAEGRVDQRLLVTLAALAAQLPVRLIVFNDPSPGASPDVPLRGAEIGAAASADLTTMLAFLTAQRPPYLPAVARIARSAGGQSVVAVRFDALGLMGLPGP